jgi:PmbA protein
MPDQGRLGPADLTDLCAVAVAQATAGDAVEAFAEEITRVQVRAREGEVESLAFSESRGVGVRVIVEGKLGYAYCADPEPQEVSDLVRSARDSARFAQEDPGNVLPAIGAVEVLDGLFDEGQAAVPTERKVKLALELERMATSKLPDVRKVESVGYGDARSRVAVASTALEGGPLEFSRTDCWASATCLAERDGETETGWSFDLARGLGGLDVEAVGAEAAQRAARLLGGRKPATERLPVVLDPGAAASFLSVLSGALSAEAVQKGRSPFADLVGEAVGSELVTLVDDGRLDGGPSSAPFDGEGVGTGRTTLVDAGVLQGFLHNAYTASRARVRSTGNAGRMSYRTVPGVSPTNLHLQPGELDVDTLLRRAGRAVYVQDVSGLHSGASSISGTFSVGAAGLRIEGGTLTTPLREMTIASTLLDMLKAIVALGSDLRFYPFGAGLGAPTVLVGEMTIAGT